MAEPSRSHACMHANCLLMLCPARSFCPCSLGWSVKRDLPLPSEHGGPLCTAQLSVPLAPGSRRQLAGLLQGESSTAQLLRSDDSGEASSAALYPLAWLLRGDLCVSSPLQLRDVLAGSGSGAPDWSTQWVACNASLLPSAAGESWGPAFSGTGSQGAGVAQQRRLAANAWSGGGSSKLGSSMASWWQLDCWAVNASSDPLQAVEQQGTAQCGGDYAGPRYAMRCCFDAVHAVWGSNSKAHV